MRAVVFDFDGTIADSFSTVIAIAYRLTGKQQLADIKEIQALRDNNASLPQAIKSLRIPRWQWPWLLQQGRRMMARQIHQVPVFPGIPELLKRIKEDNFQIFIISTNSTVNVERFLVEKGLLPYFDRIYGGAGLFDKARLIRKVLKNEKLAPTSAIYVGDEVRDIVAAKQMGMPNVAVTWGYNSADLLIQSSPTFVVRSIKQLETVIIEWGNRL